VDWLAALGHNNLAARDEIVPPTASNGLAPGAYVCLSVMDDGIGMDEQTLARATEPFFTTKGVGKGTGLGLSMVHGLAAQSGGQLVLRSWRGEGTTAEIWLPAAQEQVAATAEAAIVAPPIAASAGSALFVLAVDDDPLVLGNTAAMLQDLGHRVVVAASGREALDVLRAQGPVDLVITDLAMPAMTGLQLAAAIKSDRPAMPVIVTTGYSELTGDSDLPKLSKPFLREELACAIAACMDAAEEAHKILPFRTRGGTLRSA
jgi:CheY-like chemotaxis protein